MRQVGAGLTDENDWYTVPSPGLSTPYSLSPEQLMKRYCILNLFVILFRVESWVNKRPPALNRWVFIYW